MLLKLALMMDWHDIKEMLHGLLWECRFDSQTITIINSKRSMVPLQLASVSSLYIFAIFFSKKVIPIATMT